MTRYRVEILINKKWHNFGVYRNKDFANAVAMVEREKRKLPVAVVEIEVE